MEKFYQHCFLYLEFYGLQSTFSHDLLGPRTLWLGRVDMMSILESRKKRLKSLAQSHLAMKAVGSGLLMPGPMVFPVNLLVYYSLEVSP